MSPGSELHATGPEKLTELGAYRRGTTNLGAEHAAERKPIVN